jgi:hypothetical protein
MLPGLWIVIPRGRSGLSNTRAQKLAPDNDEVKKLCDEVVRLLDLKTN